MGYTSTDNIPYSVVRVTPLGGDQTSELVVTVPGADLWSLRSPEFILDAGRPPSIAVESTLNPNDERLDTL